MLTEQNLKNNLIAAYFIDNERKNIEILIKENDQNLATIIPYDENNPDYKLLSKFVTIDQLHEVTYQKNKKDKEIYEQKIMEIAKRDGLLVPNSDADSKFYPTLVKAIFEDETNSDHLFALKLALFELDKIKNSDKEDLKKKLRQSKSKIDVLQAAFELTK